MRLPHGFLAAAATAAFAASLGSGGCMFQNLSPTRMLTDQVQALNDETRWARVDLAADRVAPDYRTTFLASHRGWGRDIQIADAELTNVALAAGEETASSLVTISWYDLSTMEVRSSTIVQHWIKTDNGFLLDEERVTDGDEAILILPEEDATEADDEGVSPADAPLAAVDPLRVR
jgi:hypothetical protein